MLEIPFLSLPPRDAGTHAGNGARIADDVSVAVLVLIVLAVDLLLAADGRRVGVAFSSLALDCKKRSGRETLLGAYGTISEELEQGGMGTCNCHMLQPSCNCCYLRCCAAAQRAAGGGRWRRRRPSAATRAVFPISLRLRAAHPLNSHPPPCRPAGSVRLFIPVHLLMLLSAPPCHDMCNMGGAHDRADRPYRQ